MLGAAAHCCTCAMRNRKRPVVTNTAAGHFRELTGQRSLKTGTHTPEGQTSCFQESVATPIGELRKPFAGTVQQFRQKVFHVKRKPLQPELEKRSSAGHNLK